MHIPENHSGEYVLDEQYENQRGWFLFGSAMFSKSSLVPHDPSPYTSVSGKNLGKRLEDFEVPNTQWEWAWPTWYVDMSSNVDDQGWKYSCHFGSKHWRGTQAKLRSFVRRRRWVRLRKRKVCFHEVQLVQKNPSVASLVSGSSGLGLAGLKLQLAECRNDRERSQVIILALERDPQLVEEAAASPHDLLSDFEFPGISTAALVHKLERNSVWADLRAQLMLVIA